MSHTISKTVDPAFRPPFYLTALTLIGFTLMDGVSVALRAETTDGKAGK